MKIALLALISLLASTTAFARFDASVDDTTISEADTLRLTLRTDSASITSNPDFEPLQKDFDILSNQRSSQIQSFNGQVDALTTWTLVLKPKHTGTLQIPPITLSDESSQPIEITIKELDPQLKRAIAQTVFFETTYTPKQVYVQSQIVVTRRLFYVNGAQLYGDMPNAPDIPGAMVKLLGESEHSTAVRDGRQYGMIEQRFAVFPERSGDLTIPAATVTGSVRLADSGMGRRIGVDVSSDTLKVPVLPIPAGIPTRCTLASGGRCGIAGGLAWGTGTRSRHRHAEPAHADRARRRQCVVCHSTADTHAAGFVEGLPRTGKAQRIANPQRRRRNAHRIHQPGRNAAGRRNTTRGARNLVGYRQPTSSHGRAAGACDQDHR